MWSWIAFSLRCRPCSSSMKCFEDLSGPELAAPHTFIQQANTGSTCGSALVVKTAKFSADCALSTCVLMPSACEVAKRNLVRLLRKLGKQYGVSVVTNLRESPPHDVNRCYRSVARKAHPDKPGGCKSDFQELSAAHDAWTDLHKAERPVGDRRNSMSSASLSATSPTRSMLLFQSLFSSQSTATASASRLVLCCSPTRGLLQTRGKLHRSGRTSCCSSRATRRSGA